MTPLFKKLNLGKHETVLVLSPPELFETELSLLDGIQIKRRAPANPSVLFAIGFAITQSDLASVSKKLIQATEGDSVVWLAYPKGTSKKYKCEFNRDTGWSVLGDAGFEPVRIVAIDDDWCALRFRRVEHIKTLTRNPSMRISKVGKSK